MYYWEQLTAPRFVRAVEAVRGVCVLPLGVLEKHGEHLPIGTDVLLVREIARRATAIEPAIIFPPYFFTQIFEAQHVPGTVAINSRVMYDLLETTCDEISRNGCKKIILQNGHGGNEFLLPHFIRLQVERPRDYAVYMTRGMSDARTREAWRAMREFDIDDEHAGEIETSMTLATDPALVDRDAIPADTGLPQGRLGAVAENGIYTAIGWYANFPHHYAGRAEFGTAEKGEFLLNAAAQRLAKVIRIVKDDDRTLALQQEFFDLMERGPR
jgi:creatinine amidohydrolase